MNQPNNTDISGLSFEQAIKELETIVKKLEGGQVELEHAIADYARGSVLKAHCQKKLEDARLKVEKIVTAQDGSISTAPFELN